MPKALYNSLALLKNKTNCINVSDENANQSRIPEKVNPAETANKLPKFCFSNTRTKIDTIFTEPGMNDLLESPQSGLLCYEISFFMADSIAFILVSKNALGSS